MNGRWRTHANAHSSALVLLVAEHRCYVCYLWHICLFDSIDNSTMQERLSCSDIEQIVVTESGLFMDMQQTTCWIKDAPLLLIGSNEQALHPSSGGSKNCFFDCVGGSFGSCKGSILGSSLLLGLKEVRFGNQPGILT